MGRVGVDGEFGRWGAVKGSVTSTLFVDVAEPRGAAFHGRAVERGENPEESFVSETWADVDRYFAGRLLRPDEDLCWVLEANAAAGLPAIDVTPLQGKFLKQMVQVTGAGRVLEVGTLGGYSTIWMARGLPSDGRVVTIELESRHAEIAASNFERAGVSSLVDCRVGSAADVLDELKASSVEPFDLAFVDADKESSAVYFEKIVPLMRDVGMMIFDNVVRDGTVVNESTEDVSTQGVRQLMAAIDGDDRVSATALQTVGGKGYDGFLMAVVGRHLAGGSARETGHSIAG